MFQLSDYHYNLPSELIAQHPCKKRNNSKLFHLNRSLDQFTHCRFNDIEKLLKKGDLLVVNNTRVIPARLMGNKETGGRVEVLIIDFVTGMKRLQETGYFQAECLIKASRRPKPGTWISFENNVKALIVEHKGYISEVRFDTSDNFMDFLDQSGDIPLPPYIHRDNQSKPSDKENYQTVYASEKGAVAAPTAGLHFTRELMERLKEKGIKIAELTLHVGYGTFVPVKVEDIRDHTIHSEYFTVSKGAAATINKAKKEGRRIIAVGTTSVRTLEYTSDEKGCISPGTGSCDLFIYPGYRFKCVDAMITNFHLPESTLIMLISAFYSREKILAAYEEAIKEKYRFFSYGDAMFIE
jgi:S-adenosylmethionine:tRNA ribosyltransferase-isomerase